MAVQGGPRPQLDFLIGGGCGVNSFEIESETSDCKSPLVFF